MHQVYANERQIAAIGPGAPRARMVDIGERRLALTCSGEGMPTVVLETGVGAESSDSAEVYQGVESVTRVCRYDRAGRGAGQPAPGPRDALRMVEDRRELKLSSRATYSVARSSGYFIQRDDPCAVLAVIRTVIAQARCAADAQAAGG